MRFILEPPDGLEWVHELPVQPATSRRLGVDLTQGFMGGIVTATADAEQSATASPN
jgi:hypothetical protein